MTDKAQAKKDLEFCNAELSEYQNLTPTRLRHSELIAIDNLRMALYE